MSSRPVKVISGTGNLRNGKGFSLGELKAAGVSRVRARQLGLPIDSRRGSCHDHNVATIQQRAASA